MAANMALASSLMSPLILARTTAFAVINPSLMSYIVAQNERLKAF
jgi:hypothetical protein